MLLTSDSRVELSKKCSPDRFLLSGSQVELTLI